VKPLIYHPSESTKLLNLDADPESFEAMLMSEPIITFEDMESHIFADDQLPAWSKGSAHSQEGPLADQERRNAEEHRARMQTRRLTMYAFNISPGIVDQVARQLDKIVVHGFEGMHEADCEPYHCEKRDVYLRPQCDVLQGQADALQRLLGCMPDNDPSRSRFQGQYVETLKQIVQMNAVPVQKAGHDARSEDDEIKLVCENLDDANAALHHVNQDPHAGDGLRQKLLTLKQLSADGLIPEEIYADAVKALVAEV